MLKTWLKQLKERFTLFFCIQLTDDTVWLRKEFTGNYLIDFKPEFERNQCDKAECSG